MTQVNENYNNHLVIYSIPNCIQCRMTKQLLDKLNYPYSDNYHGNEKETNIIDINSEDETKREWSLNKIESLKNKTKLRQMPIVKVRDEKTGELLDVWGGFQPSKIKHWFSKATEPESESSKTLVGE